MKKITLILFILILGNTAYSQWTLEISKRLQSDTLSDSLNNYFLKYLNYFDTTDADYIFWCSGVAEKIGDYNYANGNYLVAINYYDSADTKYYNRFPTDSQFGEKELTHNRKIKIYECYYKLNEFKNCIKTLTPYILEEWAWDSLRQMNFIKLVKQEYSGEAIKNNLKYALENLNYSVLFSKRSNREEWDVTIQCKMQLFESNIDVLNILSTVNDCNIPSHLTREATIDYILKSKIYRYLSQ
jgi:hypothetical protein